MANKDFSGRLHDAVENYYQYNPSTLMPLIMVALAAQGKLTVSAKLKKGNVAFCSISPAQIEKYDWVQLDPALKKRIKQAIAEKQNAICVEGSLEPSLKNIFDTFLEYDTSTVVREYHHRIGRLVHHSSNEACEAAQRQYATLCLAEALIESPIEWLQDTFLHIANHILVKSGLQPERPRLRVAEALNTLLEYDGKSAVYNPFAGCAIAAAMLRAGDNLYADADNNDKLFAAARLLNYGTGGDNSHIEQRDSTKWLKGRKFKYVLSTYSGYIDGKSTFDFCLSQCFDSLTTNGRYAGIVSPKDIFENQSPEMKDALKRDWVDTIVLLPFGEVAVLINVKKEKEMQGFVRFFDLTHPMLRNQSFDYILNDNDYAEIFSVSDVMKKGFLKELILPELPERDGFEIVKLSDFVCKIKRQTYSLARVPEDERVLAYVDRKHTYNKYNFPWMNSIAKRPVSSLFAPAYHLDADCLITNMSGRLEPRLFDADQGSAYFQDGFAFKLTQQFDSRWLIMELNEPYALRQLHPYGINEMVPEAITEEQILNLKIYREIEGNNDIQEELDGIDPDADKLPMGYILKGDNIEYTIHKFLGHGYFGYTYSALSHSLTTGEQKEVVLKEFYPYRHYHRDGVRAILNDEDDSAFIEDSRKKFIDEAEIMKLLGNLPDSHIVPAFELFSNDETDTTYYVMPFYHEGSLDDLQNSGFTFTEEMIINKIVKPLCKALHIAHNNKVLHLDIKPENILVDENGDAILIDFGVARQYDKKGDIIDARGATANSMFSAPELVQGNMVHFGGQTDIYGLAASIYYLIASPEVPHPIIDFSDQDQDLRWNLAQANCSEQFINAVVAGLQFSATSRPANAQAFLNLFPGCEDIKLK